ncbi:hypothetical protein N7G274_000950 [Stereocaulon virgatum]|uniref:Uncharacterized protein n=1 Tax=Stereocaulon virgatum TaxID=373712 RepID=A0ABR4AMF6_9LECA
MPCACWLFDLLPQDIPIPLSLIHPRWLFNAPELVERWEMSLDPSIAIEEDQDLGIEQDEGNGSSGESGESGEGGESDGGDINRGPGARSQRMPPGVAPGATRGGAAPGGPRPTRLGDHFERRGTTILEENAISAYDLHNSLPDAAKKELYAKEFDKTIKRLNERFLKKMDPERPLPKIFPQCGQEKNLTYKKGGSRRRAYTGREAAEAEEIEAMRIAQHEKKLKQDEETKINCTQDYYSWG